MVQLLGSIHFGTKSVVFIIILIFFMNRSFLDSKIKTKLTLCPEKIMDGELWRLITSVFIHTDILQLVVNMVTLIATGISLESSLGTISFYYHIIIFALFTSVFHTLAAVASNVFELSSEYQSNSIGFSGVLIALIIIDAPRPGNEKSFFGLFLMPSLLYPWVIFLIISILFPNMALYRNISGIAVGYLYRFGILKILIPSLSSFTKIEKIFCCCNFSRLGLVTAESARNYVYRPFLIFPKRNNDDGQQRYSGDTPTIDDALDENSAHDIGELSDMNDTDEIKAIIESVDASDKADQNSAEEKL